MLVGIGYGSGGFPKSVEVINLDESNPDLTCDNLPDFPFTLQGATGQVFQGSKPIICGGVTNQCDCYSLEDGMWNPIANLTECRQYADSVTLEMPERHEEILLVTGGYNDEFTTLSSVESFDGEAWDNERFADMQFTLQKHCTVKISSSKVLMIGGSRDSSYTGALGNTYFFDITENVWFPGPLLQVPRLVVYTVVE